MDLIVGEEGGKTRLLLVFMFQKFFGRCVKVKLARLGKVAWSSG